MCLVKSFVINNASEFFAFAGGGLNAQASYRVERLLSEGSVIAT